MLACKGIFAKPSISQVSGANGVADAKTCKASFLRILYHKFKALQLFLEKSRGILKFFCTIGEEFVKFFKIACKLGRE